jgi:hypothetical protein
VAVKSALFEGEPVVAFVDFTAFVESEFVLAEKSGAIWLFDDTNNLTVLFYLNLGSAAWDVAALAN